VTGFQKPSPLRLEGDPNFFGDGFSPWAQEVPLFSGPSMVDFDSFLCWFVSAALGNSHLFSPVLATRNPLSSFWLGGSPARSQF